tara:strand:- start:205 stop:369 length:165 start_codon:yes stop_codon:yes gene_type:complete
MDSTSEEFVIVPRDMPQRKTPKFVLSISDMAVIDRLPLTDQARKDLIKKLEKGE